MAASATFLTGDIGTNDPQSTASINPTGDYTYLKVTLAHNSGNPDSDDVIPSGARATWTLIATQLYGSRRMVFLFRGTGTATEEAISLTYNGIATFQEFEWKVVEISNGDTGDPDDTPVTNSTNNNKFNATADVGTPGANDIILAFGSIENGSDSLVNDDGTILGTADHDGGNVRSGIAWQTTDETPQMSWATNGASGLIALIVNGTAGGGGTWPHGPLGHPFHGPFGGPLGA